MVARVERGCVAHHKDPPPVPAGCGASGGRALPRGEAGIELRFLGPDCNQGLDVDLGRLGPGEDLEAVDLRLLAQLEALGYAVERPLRDGDA